MQLLTYIVSGTADAQRNDLAEWQAYGAVVASEPQ